MILKAGTAARQRSPNCRKKAGVAARRVTLTAAWKKLLFLLFALTSLLSATERPNLIVILVDAMGFEGERTPPKPGDPTWQGR